MFKNMVTSVDTQNDNFVGLKFFDGKPLVIFPRGYELSNDENTIRHDIIRLIATIQKFSGRYEGTIIKNSTGDTSLSMPFLSYQYVIYDFLAHGYYTENEVNYIENTKGKINWKRTIQKEQPKINNGNVVYLKFITKTNRINENNLITKIHEFCVYESFTKLGWLFIGKDIKPKKPTIKFNRATFISVLKQELGNTFNDRKRMLFQSMLNIISQADDKFGDKFNDAFGVDRFEYVWEGMIDYVFGESNKEEFFPHAKWKIIKRDGSYETQSSALEPDTIMLLDGNCYILDAKYYSYGIKLNNPNLLPPSSSIEKQIVYGEFVEENKGYSSNQIYNAFIMPYNAKLHNDSEPYMFVGIGTADWKPIESNKKYHNVLGILMDTRYLINTYSKHNSMEIETLANMIEEIYEEYV